MPRTTAQTFQSEWWQRDGCGPLSLSPERAAEPFKLIVFLLAGDDVDFPARVRKVKCQIREDLAGGRMIRKEETIEEDNAPHFNTNGYNKLG
jgi:hypothetical protein